MENNKNLMLVLLAGLGTVAATNVSASVVFSNTAEGAVWSDWSSTTYGPVSVSGYEGRSAIWSGASGTAYSYVAGTDSGAYSAKAYGASLHFDTSAHLTQSLVLTNDLGTSADFSVDFYLHSGLLSAYGDGDGYGGASYELSIKQGSSTILFSSAASISNTGALTQSGTQLSGASRSGSRYTWNDTVVSANMGTLAAGASTTINYDLVVTAFGMYRARSCPMADGPFGTTVVLSNDTEDGECSSKASFGDPFQVNSLLPPVVTVNATGTVPEPVSLGLIGLGLGVLATHRRKNSAA